jgi:hypothetical protein
MFHVSQFSLNNLLASGFKIILLLMLLLMQTGCLEDEKKATILFFHDAPTFGLLDLVVNNQVIDQIDPNQFGRNLGLETGNNDIEVRISGENSALTTLKLNAQAQQYVLVFRGDQTEMTSKVIAVQATPSSNIDLTKHYIETLNLSDSDNGINVFIEQEKFLSNPPKEKLTDFKEIQANEQVSIGINDAENESPLVVEKYDLNPNVLSLLLVYTVEKQNGIETKFKLIEIADLNNTNQ